MRQRQAGFGVIEIIIAIVVVGIIGLLGWRYFFNTDRANDNSHKTTGAQTTQREQALSPDTYKLTPINASGWNTINLDDQGYKISYPSEWFKAEDSFICSDNVLRLGSTLETAGKCEPYDQSAHVKIAVRNSNDSPCSQLNANTYDDIAKTSVKIDDGSTAVRQSGTIRSTPGNETGGYTGGTKVVEYCITHHHRDYDLRYSQKPTYPDLLNEFETMVRKTLGFTH